MRKQMSFNPVSWIASVGKLAWHVHHEALLEVLTEPIEVRRAYIRTSKPAAEVPERLLRLQVVRGPVPDGIVKASAVIVRAYSAWSRAKADWFGAYAVWGEANTAWGEANAVIVGAKADWFGANAAWGEANAAWGEANAAWFEANAAWNRVYAANLPALLALHAAECGCGWTPERGLAFDVGEAGR